MPDQQGKSDVREKRTGSDRRLREGTPLRLGIERRKVAERRQTSVSEISYFEWASHFVRFHGRVLAGKSGRHSGQQPEAGEPA